MAEAKNFVRRWPGRLRGFSARIRGLDVLERIFLTSHPYSFFCGYPLDAGLTKDLSVRRSVSEWEVPGNCHF